MNDVADCSMASYGPAYGSVTEPRRLGHSQLGKCQRMRMTTVSAGHRQHIRRSLWLFGNNVHMFKYDIAYSR
jgi:hypothetical protein